MTIWRWAHGCHFAQGNAEKSSSTDLFGDLHCPHEQVARYLAALVRLITFIRRHERLQTKSSPAEPRPLSSQAKEAAP